MICVGTASSRAVRDGWPFPDRTAADAVPPHGVATNGRCAWPPSALKLHVDMI